MGKGNKVEAEIRFTDCTEYKKRTNKWVST